MKKISPIIHNVFQSLPEIVVEINLPNAFYEARIIFIPKPEKYSERERERGGGEKGGGKRNYRPIFLININKILKILSKCIRQYM